MLDLKTMNSALEQLEVERKIPKEKIIEAIEQALAAAYKKDYGKRGQIVRAVFDLNVGTTTFSQIKKVVDETTAVMPKDGDDEEVVHLDEHENTEDDGRVRFDPEKHILLEDAKKMKKDVELGEEIVFPLETQEDFGRIAAQTAKQVIIQRIREAERESIIGEFGGKSGDIVSGIVQKIERGMVFVDFGRAVGILPSEEQIPGEFFRRGERVRAYLYHVDEGPRGVTLRLSRTHPMFLKKLFEMEAPEIATEVVEIKAIAREPGSRSKIAVWSNDESVDPVGSCVGQKGVRVTTVMSELSGEKIDIIEWSADPANFIAKSLSPSKVLDIQVNEEEHKAFVEVADDQLSLAIGKGGQNVRLAAKLTGWRIDIKGITAETVTSSDGELVVDADKDTAEEYTSLSDLKTAISSLQKEGVDSSSDEQKEDSEKKEAEDSKEEAE